MTPEATTTTGGADPRTRLIALLEQGVSINKQATECMDDMLDELGYCEGEHPGTVCMELLDAVNGQIDRLGIWEVELIREIETLKREQQS